MKSLGAVEKPNRRNGTRTPVKSESKTSRRKGKGARDAAAADSRLKKEAEFIGAALRQRLDVLYACAPTGRA